MSIKKVVGKAVVGALVVLGAVGGAVAQSPFNSNLDYAEDALNAKAELPIQFTVDLRAVLFAIPNTDGLAGSVPGLDTMTNAVNYDNDLVGNVGWLLVESNASSWDILVKRDNGGFLARLAKEGDAAGIVDTLGGDWVYGPWRDTGTGTWADPVRQIRDSTFEGGVRKVKLRHYSSTNSQLEPCSLQIAVGVLDTVVLANTATILNTIKSNTNVKVAAPLQFGANSASPEYASFAYSLYDTLKTYSTATTDGSGYFGVNGAMLWSDVATGMGASTCDNAAFPQILGGRVVGLDAQYGGPQYTTPKPNTRDQTMAFYINAAFDFDWTNPVNKVTGNKNGEYTENLIFTFYGSY